jgi:hypothetical protein
VTDYTFSKVAVYAELGGALRLARNSRTFVTDTVTGLPVNVTQGAFTAPYLDTDSSGIADFTATTPGPIRLTTGATFVDVYSEQLPGDLLAAEASAAASAASAAASAALVGAPADSAVAAIMASGASASRVVTDGIYPQGSGLPFDGSNATGVDPTGATDSTAALQAVIDAHAASPTEANKVLRLQGVFLLASTLYLKGNTDAANAVFNYTGSGVAVQIGSSAIGNVGRWHITLGDIVCTTKPAGATWVAGSVGLKLTNVSRCKISYNAITNFETGLLLFGDGTYGTGGVAYNSFECGTLENNKVNQSLQIVTGAVAGWTNENVFNGGSMTHTDGTYPVAGMRHVLIGTTGGGSQNNNRWIGCCLETALEEYALDIYGCDNMWIGCRWEGYGHNPPTIWRATSARNMIIGGYDLTPLMTGRTVEVGATTNTFISPQQQIHDFVGDGGLVLSNQSGGGLPAITVMNVNWKTAGNTIAANYMAKVGNGYVKLRSSTDGFDRILLDGVNRFIKVGLGSAAPATGFFWSSGSPEGAVTAPPGAIFQSTNATTGGLYQKMTGTGTTGWQLAGHAPYTTAGRPTAVSAGIGGAYYDTTLSKPGFSDGTTWRDAMGTAI